MTGTFHPAEITISSYLVQTNTAGMGSLITSHNATEEKTGTGSSQKKERGALPLPSGFFWAIELSYLDHAYAMEYPQDCPPQDWPHGGQS